jgi:cytidine deaminase
MCRQTLLEFTPDPTKVRVIAVGPGGTRAEWTVAELIPHGFTGKQLDTVAPAPVPKAARKRT